jgi:WD40 repeat protein
MDKDRDLLFGLLAVQSERVDPHKLAEVSALWHPGQDRPFSQHLVESGLLSQADCQLIDELLEKEIEMEGGSVSQTLKRFGGDAQVYDSSLEPQIRTESGVLHSTIPNLSPGAVRAGKSAAGVREIPGRYSHIGEYARGGMGRILVVHDEFLGRDIALKELLPVAGFPVNRDTPASVAAPMMGRFLHEARITGQLEHPSIVPVYELGYRADGSLYYTMKLVRGTTLSDAIKDAGSLPKRLKLLPHFADLCNAIAYAHSRNVIHRDIKPGNVMVGEFGETVVLDWGLAKLKQSRENSSDILASAIDPETANDDALAAMTSPGRAVGTPAYMPPEQARGQLMDIDERSDVYALGAVLYELISGNPPYTGKTPADVLKKVVLEAPSDLSRCRPAIPEELIAICRRAMARAAEDRYQTAKELADEVQRFQSGGLVQAYAYQISDLVRWFVRKYRPIVITAGVALIALLTVGAYSYANVRAARAEEHRLRVESESRLYEVSIGLARRHIEDAKLDVARENLAACPPNLRNWEWGRLQYICNASFVSLTGHAGRVIDSAFSPDGSRLATLDDESTIFVWDLVEAKEHLRVDAGHGGFGKVAFSPSGEEFATCGGDGRISLWNAETGSRTRTLDGHAGNVQGLAFTPDGENLISGAEDGVIRVWDSVSGEPVRMIRPGGPAVQDIAVNDSGDRAVVACGDGTVLIFDLLTGGELHRIDAHPVNLHVGVLGAIRVSFRPGYDQAASCGCDDTVRLWDTTNGELLRTFHGHVQKVWSVSFTHDGKTLATCGTGGQVKLWNPDTAEELPSSIGLNTPLVTARFSPDSTRIATGGNNSEVRVWDVGEPFGAYRLQGHHAEVNGVAFSRDGKVLASGAGHWAAGGDSRVLLWDSATREILRVLDGHVAPVFTMAFHPNGLWLTSSGVDCRVITWNIQTGDIVREFLSEDDRNGVRAIAYDPTGKLLITGGWNGDDSLGSSAVIWDAETGARLHVLKPHGGALDDVAWSRDGSLVATACRDGVLRVWDPATGALKRELVGDDSWVYGVAFDPGGPRIASAHASGAIYVWDRTTGRQLQHLNGHTIRVNKLTYSPDGSRLASCDNMGVNVWNSHTGRLLLSLPHGSHHIAFSHDATTLATAGMDGDVVLWPTLPWK